MAGSQTNQQAGQKSPEQVEAEKSAAADKAAAEKAAAEKAAAEKGTADKPETKPKGYLVTGAAVILRTEDGGERYLYRGAPVDSGAFAKESIKHALSIGLIEKAK